MKYSPGTLIGWTKRRYPFQTDLREQNFAQVDRGKWWMVRREWPIIMYIETNPSRVGYDHPKSGVR